MGFVLSAAALEWFLWLAAFLYCLVKVFKKAEHWTIRLLAVIMIFGFTALRLVKQTRSPRMILNLLQMHISACHDRHAAIASTDHCEIPSRTRQIPAMVRLLLLLRPSDYPMALLCLPISRQ